MFSDFVYIIIVLCLKVFFAACDCYNRLLFSNVGVENSSGHFFGFSMRYYRGMSSIGAYILSSKRYEMAASSLRYTNLALM